MTLQRTIIYIDGFNLYYGALKRTNLKWLNVHAMCRALLPEEQNAITRIYYFTALVSGTTDDPHKPERQHLYVRALRTIPELEIIDGKFITDKVTFQRADGSGPVEVLRTKEKRSDVNLVSQMLWDAHCGNFDVAVLVSGDTDFTTPVEMVRHRYNKQIGVFDPQRDGTPQSPMNKAAHFYKPIRQGLLRASQFPLQLTDGRGTFAKPQDWF